MSYNILANCYADSSLAKGELYPYCPDEYLNFKYRRVLLIHEIKSNPTIYVVCDKSFKYFDDALFRFQCGCDFLARM